MPEPGNFPPLTPAEIVSRFFGAIAEHDHDGLGELIDRCFQPGAVAVIPASLPYGGRVETAARLRTMFQRVASGPGPAGPQSIAVRGLVDGGDRVAVQLDFDWRVPGTGHDVASGALELWSFVDGRVSEIRAYYWDTAALVNAMTERP